MDAMLQAQRETQYGTGYSEGSKPTLDGGYDGPYNETKPAQGGVQGYSTEAPYSRYAIFCVGQSIAKQAAFRAWGC